MAGVRLSQVIDIKNSGWCYVSHGARGRFVPFERTVMETKTNLFLEQRIRGRLTCSSFGLCPNFGDTITVDCVVFVQKQAFK